VLFRGRPSPTDRAAVRAARRESFELTQHELVLPSLHPAHDGLRVAQLSDLHIGHGVPPGRIARAVAQVNSLEPDVVVLTGDFVTNARDSKALVYELLAPLRAPRFAVLGNHDHWSGAPALRLGLEHAGLAVLQNRNSAVRVRGAALVVVGVDDSTTRHDDVGAAFRGAARGSRLVLTHTPSCAAKLPRDEGLLCLSGHTHGGQLDVPRLTRGVFKTIGQPWYRGAYEVGGNRLYVNRGLGFGRGTRLPRLNSEPEVTVLTLRCA